MQIRITNRWPWPVWGLALEQGFAVFADVTRQEIGESVALARVPGWSTSEFAWSFIPQRRGVYPLETPAVETGFPFGMVKARKECIADNELLVWPRTVTLESLPDTFDQAPREDQLTDRKAGDCGDMLGTRPFRQGDSLRRVHWAQTARQGRMIVCERQSPAACSVRVIVDLRPAIHSGEGPTSTLEQALRITASVCQSLRAQRASVECVIGREVVTLGNSESDWRRLLDLLARVPRQGWITLRAPRAVDARCRRFWLRRRCLGWGSRDSLCRVAIYRRIRRRSRTGPQFTPVDSDCLAHDCSGIAARPLGEGLPCGLRHPTQPAVGTSRSRDQST